MPGHQGNPSMQAMQGGGNALYRNRSRGTGGNNGGRNNNRRRRPNNQSQGAKYNQGNADPQDEFEFQPKLPSDTAPAFRFVERRGRRGNKGVPSASVSGEQHHRHHGGQTGGRNQHLKELQIQDHVLQPVPKPIATLPLNHQENITPKTLRIVPAPPTKSQLPEIFEESAQADSSFSGSSPVGKSLSQEAGSTPPSLPEPVEARSKLQLEPSQDRFTDPQSANDEDEGGVPVSWSMAADAQSESQALNSVDESIIEEPEKISIRELLDTSDIIEPTVLSKPPFLPKISVEPATPTPRKPSDIFSSPLTITKTPINPHNPESATQEPTPVERFLKLSDVTSRYLTERLSDINYNPDLSRRLKSDFEVVETAYNALPFDRSLNPYRIIWHALLGLKKSVELRNNDAKIIGALKNMTQTYDAIRHQALHERRFSSDQPPFTVETLAAAAAAAGGMLGTSAQTVSRSGDKLMETLKWNIRGGDTNVRLYEGNGNAGRATIGFGKLNTSFGFGRGTTALMAPVSAAPLYGIIGSHLKG